MEKEYHKYYTFVIILILTIISYYIIKDYITVLLSSFVLAYIFLPIHRKISKKINPKLSAFLIIFLFVLLISFFIAIISTMLVTETIELLNNKNEIISLNSFEKNAYLKDFFQTIEKSIPSLIEKSLIFLSSKLVYLISYSINLFFSITLISIITFFLLIDWEKINKNIFCLIPLKNKEELIKKASKITDSLIRTNFIIAIIELIFSIIFFTLIKSKYALLFSFLIGFFAFIPLIGPAFIWFPLLLIKLISGENLTAIYILIFGIIISYGIDNFLRNYLASKDSKVNLIIVIIGVLGGIKLFGIVGIFFGPVILSITLELIKEISKESSNL